MYSVLVYAVLSGLDGFQFHDWRRRWYFVFSRVRSGSEWKHGHLPESTKPAPDRARERSRISSPALAGALRWPAGLWFLIARHQPVPGLRLAPRRLRLWRIPAFFVLYIRKGVDNPSAGNKQFAKNAGGNRSLGASGGRKLIRAARSPWLRQIFRGPGKPSPRLFWLSLSPSPP